MKPVKLKIIIMKKFSIFIFVTILWITISQAVEKELDDLIATATFGDRVAVRVPAPKVTNGKVRR